MVKNVKNMISRTTSAFQFWDIPFFPLCLDKLTQIYTPRSKDVNIVNFKPIQPKSFSYKGRPQKIHGWSGRVRSHDQPLGWTVGAVCSPNSFYEIPSNSSFERCVKSGAALVDPSHEKSWTDGRLRSPEIITVRSGRLHHIYIYILETKTKYISSLFIYRLGWLLVLFLDHQLKAA